MLDLRFIKENIDLVKSAIVTKNITFDLDKLLELDKVVLHHKKLVEALQAERNANAKKVPSAPPEEKAQLIQRGKEIAKEIDELKPALEEAEKKVQELLYRIPNIPSQDAPVGADESFNVEVKKWGTPPEFSFKPLSHIELLQKNNWGELERIGQIAGSRSYALKNDLVQIELALLQFALDKAKKHGFQLISMPSMVKEAPLYGTGHFPDGRDQVYFIESDNIYLSGTAEVPINSLHSGEILSEKDLPLLYGGFSTCFRREAGSAGRDVKGLIRVHQFYKVEMYILCKNSAEESAKFHQKLLEIAEEILQDLEIPYRVVECCTGDMGLGKFRMFDVESWVPSEGKYRETHSCSSLHDWQARRTNLRYRDADGVVQFCHTLNNTAIATPRILVPLLENHQQADGSVKIPEKLKHYL